eukprot:TRINITY_DN6918_c0_g2_i1.p3 TRINITY_DN6918_c0_g2~~TRINITY_DN6918_c0_g2_i1.p3  ORF type:complete len:251 (+),score=71.54 TRINITY_DN6918_c0_g2_i1:68-820(+)
MCRRVCVVRAAETLRALEGKARADMPVERLHTRFVHSVANEVEWWLVKHTGQRCPRNVIKYPNYGYLTRVLELAVQAQCAVAIDGAEAWVEKFGAQYVDIEWLRDVAALREVTTDIPDASPLADVMAGVEKVPVASMDALSDTAVLRTFPQRPTGVVLTKVDGMVNAFSNRCPHVGLTLEDLDGRVHCPETASVKCAAHGALFDPSSGYCTDGPCADESLQRVPFALRDNAVLVDAPTVSDYLRALGAQE